MHSTLNVVNEAFEILNIFSSLLQTILVISVLCTVFSTMSVVSSIAMPDTTPVKSSKLKDGSADSKIQINLDKIKKDIEKKTESQINMAKNLPGILNDLNSKGALDEDQNKQNVIKPKDIPSKQKDGSPVDSVLAAPGHKIPPDTLITPRLGNSKQNTSEKTLLDSKVKAGKDSGTPRPLDSLRADSNSQDKQTIKPVAKQSLANVAVAAKDTPATIQKTLNEKDKSVISNSSSSLVSDDKKTKDGNRDLLSRG